VRSPSLICSPTGEILGGMPGQDADVVGTNVHAVRGVYDGWIDGDVTRALEYLDPEIVWEAIADAPEQWWSLLAPIWPDLDPRAATGTGRLETEVAA